MDKTTLIPTYLLIVGSISAALIGAVVSSGIIAVAGLLQRSRQRKALLVAFTTDLVERFMRATMYYNQNRTGAISYSALYEATDSNMLAKLAEVIKDQDIIHTIVELKGSYYQIQRHVLEASEFAAEQTLKKVKYEDLKQTLGPKNPRTIKAETDLREVSIIAHGAQSRALAFFGFDDMLAKTKTLINYAKMYAAGPYIVSLEAKFNERLEEKEEVERQMK